MTVLVIEMTDNRTATRTKAAHCIVRALTFIKTKVDFHRRFCHLLALVAVVGRSLRPDPDRDAMNVDVSNENNNYLICWNELSRVRDKLHWISYPALALHSDPDGTQ